MCNYSYMTICFIDGDSNGIEKDLGKMIQGTTHEKF